MVRLALPISILGLVASVLALSYDDTAIYLIRHGEKPANGSNGLSPQGEQRAQCLKSVFGPDSNYDIGFILAEHPKKDGKRERPYETVEPLAEELGLTVDTDCSKYDASCVAKAVKKYADKKHSQNILICWEHGELTNITAALGVKEPPTYPDDHFDLIWTVEDKELVSITSEDCPGLDD